MKRYAVKGLNEGKYKFYYILDNETYDVVLYPSKFLKHKIDANRSPNTVRRMAFALCYYMEYLNRQEVELEEVSEMGYEPEQTLRAVFILAIGRESRSKQSKRKHRKRNL